MWPDVRILIRAIDTKRLKELQYMTTTTQDILDEVKRVHHDSLMKCPPGKRVNLLFPVVQELQLAP